MVNSILSGLAIGLAILAVVLGQISERESRLAQHEAQLLQMKMEAHGIDTAEHQ